MGYISTKKLAFVYFHLIGQRQKFAIEHQHTFKNDR